MIITCRTWMLKHKALLQLMCRALAAGVFIILLMHFFVREAEQPKILNTIGLMLDIVGVTWIAYDLFPFNGIREYIEDERSGIETPEYTDFKRSHAALGITLVVVGFLFQILAYWIGDILEIAGAS